MEYQCSAKPQNKDKGTCGLVSIMVLFLAHPSLLQLRPLLSHIHLCQDRTSLVRFQSVFGHQDFPSDALAWLLCLPTLRRLRPLLFCLHYRTPGLIELGHHCSLRVDVFHCYVFLPAEGFRSFLLLLDVFGELIFASFGVEEGVGEEDLFFCGLVGDGPCFGADESPVG